MRFAVALPIPVLSLSCLRSNDTEDNSKKFFAAEKKFVREKNISIDGFRKQLVNAIWQ
jgi:hypothetical protein